MPRPALPADAPRSALATPRTCPHQVKYTRTRAHAGPTHPETSFLRVIHTNGILRGGCDTAGTPIRAPTWPSQGRIRGPATVPVSTRTPTSEPRGLRRALLASRLRSQHVPAPRPAQYPPRLPRRRRHMARRATRQRRTPRSTSPPSDLHETPRQNQRQINKRSRSPVRPRHPNRVQHPQRSHLGRSAIHRTPRIPHQHRPVGHRTQRPARHAHTESLTPPRPKETLNPPRQANGVAGSRLDSGNPPTRRHRQDHTYQSDGSHPATGTKTPCGKYLATLTGMPTTRPRLAVRGHPRHGLLAPGTSVRRPRHRCWRDWPRGDVGTPTRAESGCLTLPTRECGGEGEGGSATRRAGSPRCVPRRPRADRLDKASGVPAAAVSGRVLCLGRSSRARDRPGPVGWQARNVCRARRVGETERQAGEPDCACGAVSLSRQSKGVVVRGLRHHP